LVKQSFLGKKPEFKGFKVLQCAAMARRFYLIASVGDPDPGFGAFLTP
jgi:hypothetical protein